MMCQEGSRPGELVNGVDQRPHEPVPCHGQLLETQRSCYPELAWRHLAAGARVVAEVAAEDGAGAEPILAMWHSAGLSLAQDR